MKKLKVLGEQVDRTIKQGIKGRIWFVVHAVDLKTLGLLSFFFVKKLLVKTLYWLKLAPQSRCDFLLKTIHGLFLVQDLSQLAHLSPLYEKELLPYFNLPKNKVFIDCGAYIGRYTLMLARNCKKVIAIEPQSSNYRLLRKNIKINKVKNCIPLKVALWDSCGRMHLYLDRYSSGRHSLVEKKSAKKDIVKAITLDEIVRGLKIKPSDIGLIKIDVEGAEIEAIEGMKKVLTFGSPKLIIECRTRNISKLKRLLELLGYKHEIVSENPESIYFYATKLSS